MTGYIVASGSVVTWKGGRIVGGSPVTPEVLAEWGAEGLRANLDAGTVIETAPESPAQPRARR